MNSDQVRKRKRRQILEKKNHGKNKFTEISLRAIEEPKGFLLIGKRDLCWNKTE